MQTITEKLYYPVALYWSKGKEPKTIKRIVMQDLKPMSHKECMVFISKMMKVEGRTFTVQEIEYHFIGF